MVLEQRAFVGRILSVLFSLTFPNPDPDGKQQLGGLGVGWGTRGHKELQVLADVCSTEGMCV